MLCYADLQWRPTQLHAQPHTLRDSPSCLLALQHVCPLIGSVLRAFHMLCHAVLCRCRNGALCSCVPSPIWQWHVRQRGQPTTVGRFRGLQWGYGVCKQTGETLYVKTVHRMRSARTHTVSRSTSCTGTWLSSRHALLVQSLSVAAMGSSWSAGHQMTGGSCDPQAALVAL
jgi:hypothetical protein